MTRSYPKVITSHKFPGPGQRETPVTNAQGVVHIINNLGGPRAARFRTKCADLVVRYLGADESLVGEIQRIKAAQEELPGDHPLRTFGKAVEAERDQLDEEMALKRQKFQNELDRETAQGQIIKAEAHWKIAEAKNKLLDELARSALPATPALHQLIQAARCKFASQSLCQLNSGGLPMIEPPPTVSAHRITIQEVGRDMLKLPAAQLSAEKLSVVGRTVGSKWTSLPGKGSITEAGADESGQKKWERTFEENGAKKTAIITGHLTEKMLAQNRIEFSEAYLGAREISVGQARPTTSGLTR